MTNLCPKKIVHSVELSAYRTILPPRALTSCATRCSRARTITNDKPSHAPAPTARPCMGRSYATHTRRVNTRPTPQTTPILQRAQHDVTAAVTLNAVTLQQCEFQCRANTVKGRAHLADNVDNRHTSQAEEVEEAIRPNNTKLNSACKAPTIDCVPVVV
jgi:hypothetical protein